MKTKLILFLICVLCTCTALQAQNLVPNGSFETPDPAYSCPNGDNGYNDTYNRPQYWTGYVQQGYNTIGDYFYTCSGTNYFSPTSSNLLGCQLPLNGQAYAGFVAAAVNYVQYSQAYTESEYLINSNISLTGGVQYYVEFYVANANSAACTFGSNCSTSNASSKNIGAYFTRGAPIGTGNGLNNLFPQVPSSIPGTYASPNSFPEPNFNTSYSWQKISGYFTPNTTGTWTMVIGNFDPGMNTSTVYGSNTYPTPNLQMQSNSGYPSVAAAVQNILVSAYYFVDAVTIIPATQTPPSYAAYVTPTLQSACAGVSSSYTLQNIPFGATANWSVSPTNLFTSATSGAGATASLTAGYGQNGIATLTYSLSSACSVYPAATTQIAVGTEVNSFSIYYTNVTCVNNEAYLYVDYTPIFISATDIKYYAKDMSNPNNPYVLKEDDPYPGSVGGNGSDFPIGQSNRNYTILIVATFPCGTLQASKLVTAPTCTGGGGGGASIVAFPNPASSTMTVQLTDSTSNTQSGTLSQPFQLSITDRFSTKVLSLESSDKTITFPTDGIPAGIYFLNVIYKDAVLQKQVMIKR